MGVSWETFERMNQNFKKALDECDALLVPRSVVEHALSKARHEYVRVAEEQDTSPGPADECWAEFEALAEYAPGWGIKARTLAGEPVHAPGDFEIHDSG